MKTESKPKLHKATSDYLESVAKSGDENARALLHNVRAFSALNAKQQKQRASLFHGQTGTCNPWRAPTADLDTGGLSQAVGSLTTSTNLIL